MGKEEIYISNILKYDKEFGGILSSDDCRRIIARELGCSNYVENYVEYQVICEELRKRSENEILVLKKIYVI